MAMIRFMNRFQRIVIAFLALATFSGVLASCGRTSSVSGVLRVGNDAGFGYFVGNGSFEVRSIVDLVNW